MALARPHVLGGVLLGSEAKMVRYPDRSVDERGHAFGHTLWVEMREQVLALP